MNLNHLLNVLQCAYDISIEWTGRYYCGLSIDWNDDRNYVNILISDYITKKLYKYQYPSPKYHQHIPHK